MKKIFLFIKLKKNFKRSKIIIRINNCRIDKINIFNETIIFFEQTTVIWLDGSFLLIDLIKTALSKKSPILSVRKNMY